MDLENFEVGKCSESLVGGETVLFRFDDSGAMLDVRFNRPTKKEIDSFKGDVRISYVKIGSVFMMLFKFGSSPWMDVPFSPHLMKLSEIPKLQKSQGIAFLSLLADCTNGMVHNLRLMGLPHDFSETFLADIEADLKRPFDKQMHLIDVAAVMNKYKTSDLVAMEQRASCEIRRG